MTAGRYYDWTGGQPLDQSKGCPLEVWQERSGEAVFAVHPKGFPIFLSPDELQASDEYAEGDPYAVETGINAPFQQRRVQQTLHLLQAVFSPGSAPRILDIGCGEGHITAEIARLLPDAEISALDYSVTAVERAVSLYGDIEFAVASAYDPPYQPDYFSAVVCNNLWEHVPDPLQMLRGISRVLAPGGHLLISTPSRYHLWNLLRVVRGKPVALASAKHVTEYTVGQVQEQLRFGGYDLCQISAPSLVSDVTDIKSFLVFRVIYPLLRGYLSRVDSHHSLETTVFYLSRKR